MGALDESLVLLRSTSIDEFVVDYDDGHDGDPYRVKVFEMLAQLPVQVRRARIDRAEFRRTVEKFRDLVEEWHVAWDEGCPFDIAPPTAEQMASLTREEARRLDLLMDAVVYDWAVESGTSPVAAIAERRGVTTRTAEGRIYRARKVGLLTPAEGHWASGGLSGTGWAFARKLERLGILRRVERSAA